MTIDEITLAIAEAKAEQNQLAIDAATFARLSEAPARLSAVAGNITQLEADLAEAQVAADEAARAELQAKFRKIIITEQSRRDTPPAISYEARQDNGGAAVWVPGLDNLGFGLDPSLKEHILQYCPGKLPAFIRAMAADPREALAAYMAALDRGYFVG